MIQILDIKLFHLIALLELPNVNRLLHFCIENKDFSFLKLKCTVKSIISGGEICQILG